MTCKIPGWHRWFACHTWACCSYWFGNTCLHRGWSAWKFFFWCFVELLLCSYRSCNIYAVDRDCASVFGVSCHCPASCKQTHICWGTYSSEWTSEIWTTFLFDDKLLLLCCLQDRKRTLKQIDDFFNKKVAPKELVDEIKVAIYLTEYSVSCFSLTNIS